MMGRGKGRRNVIQTAVVKTATCAPFGEARTAAKCVKEVVALQGVVHVVSVSAQVVCWQAVKVVKVGGRVVKRVRLKTLLAL